MKKKAEKDGDGKVQLAYDGRFAPLTWKDLESFAGKKAVSRGKGYVSEVSRIRVDDKGAVTASVQGGQEYATKIWFGKDGKLRSYCSCPVGFECKHAVALALKVIDEIKSGKPPVRIAEDDERLEELSLDEDLLDDELLGEENADDGIAAASPPEGARASTKKDPVRDYIAALSNDGCRELLLELVDEYGGVRTELQRRITLAKSDVETLAAKAKAAIRDATAYACRFYHWGDRDRSIYPDYSEARRFLERLLELKAYNRLIALADYLTKRSVNQMMMSENDEGQIGCEAEGCMEVIAKAVVRSDMPDVEKILWFRKLHDGDEYCFYEGIGGVWDAPNKVSKSAWSKVADELAKELSAQGDVGGGVSIVGRNLSKMAEKALRFAGRGGEIADFKKNAVAKTGDYNSLVGELMAGGDLREAREWCLRGLRNGDEYGAEELRKRMVEIAGGLGDKAEACAYVADQFFNTPCLDNYKTLISFAQKAGVTDVVRSHVLKFLEFGVLPWDEKKNRWPLPATGSTKVSRHATFPLYRVLVEISLHERRMEDAVRFYHAQGNPGERKGWWSRGTESDQGWTVADKVAEVLPDDAIAIWRGLVDANRGKAGNAYYDQIGDALKRMRPVMERQGRRGEWKALIADLRQTEKAKRNLMKILDEVELGHLPDAPIISADR